jgi:hypothetical protein
MKIHIGNEQILDIQENLLLNNRQSGITIFSITCIVIIIFAMMTRVMHTINSPQNKHRRVIKDLKFTDTFTCSVMIRENVTFLKLEIYVGIGFHCGLCSCN